MTWPQLGGNEEHPAFAFLLNTSGHAYRLTRRSYFVVCREVPMIIVRLIANRVFSTIWIFSISSFPGFCTISQENTNMPRKKKKHPRIITVFVADDVRQLYLIKIMEKLKAWLIRKRVGFWFSYFFSFFSYMVKVKNNEQLASFWL